MFTYLNNLYIRIKNRTVERYRHYFDNPSLRILQTDNSRNRGVIIVKYYQKKRQFLSLITSTKRFIVDLPSNLRTYTINSYKAIYELIRVKIFRGQPTVTPSWLQIIDRKDKEHKQYNDLFNKIYIEYTTTSFPNLKLLTSSEFEKSTQKILNQRKLEIFKKINDERYMFLEELPIELDFYRSDKASYETLTHSSIDKEIDKDLSLIDLDIKKDIDSRKISGEKEFNLFYNSLEWYNEQLNVLNHLRNTSATKLESQINYLKNKQNQSKLGYSFNFIRDINLDNSKNEYPLETKLIDFFNKETELLEEIAECKLNLFTTSTELIDCYTDNRHFSDPKLIVDLEKTSETLTELNKYYSQILLDDLTNGSDDWFNEVYLAYKVGCGNNKITKDEFRDLYKDVCLFKITRYDEFLDILNFRNIVLTKSQERIDFLYKEVRNSLVPTLEKLEQNLSKFQNADVLDSIGIVMKNNRKIEFGINNLTEFCTLSKSRWDTDEFLDEYNYIQLEKKQQLLEYNFSLNDAKYHEFFNTLKKDRETLIELTTELHGNELYFEKFKSLVNKTNFNLVLPKKITLDKNIAEDPTLNYAPHTDYFDDDVYKTFKDDPEKFVLKNPSLFTEDEIKTTLTKSSGNAKAASTVAPRENILSFDEALSKILYYPKGTDKKSLALAHTLNKDDYDFGNRRFVYMSHYLRYNYQTPTELTYDAITKHFEKEYKIPDTNSDSVETIETLCSKIKLITPPLSTTLLGLQAQDYELYNTKLVKLNSDPRSVALNLVTFVNQMKREDIFFDKYERHFDAGVKRNFGDYLPRCFTLPPQISYPGLIKSLDFLNVTGDLKPLLYEINYSVENVETPTVLPTVGADIFRIPPYPNASTYSYLTSSRENYYSDLERYNKAVTSFKSNDESSKAGLLASCIQRMAENCIAHKLLYSSAKYDLNGIEHKNLHKFFVAPDDFFSVLDKFEDRLQQESDNILNAEYYHYDDCLAARKDYHRFLNIQFIHSNLHKKWKYNYDIEFRALRDRMTNINEVIFDHNKYNIMTETDLSKYYQNEELDETDPEIIARWANYEDKSDYNYARYTLKSLFLAKAIKFAQLDAKAKSETYHPILRNNIRADILLSDTNNYTAIPEPKFRRLTSSHEELSTWFAGPKSINEPITNINTATSIPINYHKFLTENDRYTFFNNQSITITKDDLIYNLGVDYPKYEVMIDEETGVITDEIIEKPIELPRNEFNEKNLEYNSERLDLYNRLKKYNEFAKSIDFKVVEIKQKSTKLLASVYEERFTDVKEAFHNKLLPKLKQINLEAEDAEKYLITSSEFGQNNILPEIFTMGIPQIEILYRHIEKEANDMSKILNHRSSGWMTVAQRKKLTNDYNINKQKLIALRVFRECIITSDPVYMDVWAGLSDVENIRSERCYNAILDFRKEYPELPDGYFKQLIPNFCNFYIDLFEQESKKTNLLNDCLSGRFGPKCSLLEKTQLEYRRKPIPLDRYKFFLNQVDNCLPLNLDINKHDASFSTNIPKSDISERIMQNAFFIPTTLNLNQFTHNLGYLFTNTGFKQLSNDISYLSTNFYKLNLYDLNNNFAKLANNQIKFILDQYEKHILPKRILIDKSKDKIKDIFLINFSRMAQKKILAFVRGLHTPSEKLKQKLLEIENFDDNDSIQFIIKKLYENLNIAEFVNNKYPKAKNVENNIENNEGVLERINRIKFDELKNNRIKFFDEIQKIEMIEKLKNIEKTFEREEEGVLNELDDALSIKLENNIRIELEQLQYKAKHFIRKEGKDIGGTTLHYTFTKEECKKFDEITTLINHFDSERLKFLNTINKVHEKIAFCEQKIESARKEINALSDIANSVRAQIKDAPKAERMVGEIHRKINFLKHTYIEFSKEHNQLRTGELPYNVAHYTDAERQANNMERHLDKLEQEVLLRHLNESQVRAEKASIYALHRTTLKESLVENLLKYKQEKQIYLELRENYLKDVTTLTEEEELVELHLREQLDLIEIKEKNLKISYLHDEYEYFMNLFHCYKTHNFYLNFNKQRITPNSPIKLSDIISYKARVGQQKTLNELLIDTLEPQFITRLKEESLLTTFTGSQEISKLNKESKIIPKDINEKLSIEAEFQLSQLMKDLKISRNEVDRLRSFILDLKLANKYRNDNFLNIFKVNSSSAQNRGEAFLFGGEEQMIHDFFDTLYSNIPTSKPHTKDYLLPQNLIKFRFPQKILNVGLGYIPGDESLYNPILTQIPHRMLTGMNLRAEVHLTPGPGVISSSHFRYYLSLVVNPLISSMPTTFRNILNFNLFKSSAPKIIQPPQAYGATLRNMTRVFSQLRNFNLEDKKLMNENIINCDLQDVIENTGLGDDALHRFALFLVNNYDNKMPIYNRTAILNWLVAQPYLHYSVQDWLVKEYTKFLNYTVAKTYFLSDLQNIIKTASMYDKLRKPFLKNKTTLERSEYSYEQKFLTLPTSNIITHKINGPIDQINLSQRLDNWDEFFTKKTFVDPKIKIKFFEFKNILEDKIDLFKILIKLELQPVIYFFNETKTKLLSKLNIFKLTKNFINDIKRGFNDTQKPTTVANSDSDNIITPVEDLDVETISVDDLETIPVVDNDETELLIESSLKKPQQIHPYTTIESSKILAYPKPQINPISFPSLITDYLNFNIKLFETNIFKYEEHEFEYLNEEADPHEYIRDLMITPNSIINVKIFRFLNLFKNFAQVHKMPKSDIPFSPSAGIIYNPSQINIPLITSFIPVITELDKTIFNILKVQGLEPQVKPNLLKYKEFFITNYLNDMLGARLKIFKNDIFISNYYRIEDFFPYLDLPLKRLAANVLIQINNGIQYIFQFLGVDGNLTQITIFTDTSYISFLHFSKIKTFCSRGLYVIPKYIREHLRGFEFLPSFRFKFSLFFAHKPQIVRVKRTKLVRNKTKCFFIKEYISNKTYKTSNDIYIITGDTKPIQTLTNSNSYNELLNPALRSLLQFDFGYIQSSDIYHESSINPKFTLDINYKVHIDKSLSTNTKTGILLSLNNEIHGNTPSFFTELFKNIKYFYSISGLFIRQKNIHSIKQYLKIIELWSNNLFLNQSFIQKDNNLFKNLFLSQLNNNCWIENHMKLITEWLHIYRKREFTVNVNPNLYKILKSYNIVNTVYAAPFERLNPTEPVSFRSRYRYILSYNLILPQAQKNKIPYFLYENKDLRVVQTFGRLNLFKNKLLKQFEYFLFNKNFKILTKIESHFTTNFNYYEKEIKPLIFPIFDKFKILSKYNRNYISLELNKYLLKVEDITTSLVDQYIKMGPELSMKFNEMFFIFINFLKNPSIFRASYIYRALTHPLTFFPFRQTYGVWTINFFAGLSKNLNIKKLIDLDSRLYTHIVYVMLPVYNILITKPGYYIKYWYSLFIEKIFQSDIKMKKEKFEFDTFYIGFKSLIPFWNSQYATLISQLFWSNTNKSLFKPIINFVPEEAQIHSQGTFLKLSKDVQHATLLSTPQRGNKLHMWFKEHSNISEFKNLIFFIIDSIKNFLNSIIKLNLKDIYIYCKLTLTNSKNLHVVTMTWYAQNKNAYYRLVTPIFLSRTTFKSRYLTKSPSTTAINWEFYNGIPTRSPTHQSVITTSITRQFIFRYKNFLNHLGIGQFDIFDRFDNNYRKLVSKNDDVPKTNNVNDIINENIENMFKVFFKNKEALEDIKTFIFKTPYRTRLNTRMKKHKKHKFFEKKIFTKLNPITVKNKIKPISVEEKGVDWKDYRSSSKQYPILLNSTDHIKSTTGDFVEPADQTEPANLPQIEQKDIKLDEKKNTDLILVPKEEKSNMAQFYELVNDFIKTDLFSWVSFHQYRDELLRSQTDQVPMGIFSQCFSATVQGLTCIMMLFAADYRRAPNKKSAYRLLSWKIFIIFTLTSLIAFAVIHITGIDILAEIIGLFQRLFPVTVERVPQNVILPIQVNTTLDNYSTNVFNTPHYATHTASLNISTPKSLIETARTSFKNLVDYFDLRD